MDASSVDYRYFLQRISATNLRELAMVARISLPANIRKLDLVELLAKGVPRSLPNLIKGLKEEELLKCRIVAAGRGCLPSWEVHTRLQIEQNKRKDEEERKAIEGGYAKKKKRANRSSSDEYDDDADDGYDDDDDDDDGWSYGRKTTAYDLILFTAQLYPIDRRAEAGVYLMMPVEARQHFQADESLLDVKLTPLLSGTPEIDQQFAEPTDLFGLVQSLLDEIVEKRPKPTPKEGLAPKSVILPVFERFVAQSEFYKKNDNAQCFGWEDINETVMNFLCAVKLVRRGEILEVVPKKASELLSAAKGLTEEFLRWWASSDNTTSVIKSKVYEFEVKIRGIKSDEAKARTILRRQITEEMEPGKMYSVRSIAEKCALEGGSRLFENEYGVNVWGPEGVIEDLFPSFLEMMMTYPLAVLGVLEINRNYKLVRLGRWMRTTAPATPSPVSQRTVVSEADAAENERRATPPITITPDFQVILQPSARSLSFQLREFCENMKSPGPALIFRLTKQSFLNSLRRGALTADKAIEFLSSSGASLPDNVIHELKAWEERYGEVEMATIDVMRCRDEATAEMLLNDSEASRYIIRRMGKDVLEISPGSRTKLLSRCDRLGLLAKG